MTLTFTQIMLLLSSSLLCLSVSTLLILYITVELLRLKEMWLMVLMFETGSWLFIFGCFCANSFFMLMGMALELNVWVSVWVSHYSAFKNSMSTRVALFLSVMKITQVVLFTSLEDSVVIWLLIFQMFSIFMFSSCSVAAYQSLSTASYLALSLVFNEDDILITMLSIFYCLSSFFFILALESSSSMLLLFVWIYSLSGVIKYMSVESSLLSALLLNILLVWVFIPWIMKKEETMKVSSRSWLVVLLTMLFFLLLI